jgi:arginine N-succinyltransferase
LAEVQSRFIARPGLPADADQVLEVAQHLDTINLPADRSGIESILECSKKSFTAEVSLPEREYVFVLEDLGAKRIIGTSIIHAHHGTRRSPHVYFQVLKDERYSETLDHYVVHECLRLGYDYDGPTEIGGLILLPEYRGRADRVGTFLSYLRFVFIAAHRSLFRDRVLSELLPPLEADGTSRLWEHLGRRFTGLSYADADRISKHNKEFIKSLFPHGLIYTSLFPPEVREVIGKVGPETRGVEKLLTRIGFHYAHQIDPFDGGPHFAAPTDQITLVRDSRRVHVADTLPSGSPRRLIVAKDAPPLQFAATTVSGRLNEDRVALDAQSRDLLGVAVDDTVWAVAT